MEEKKQFDEEELLRKVEKVVKKNSRSSGFVSFLTILLPVAVVAGLIFGVVLPKINSINANISQLTKFSEPAESHDLVLENNGILGYTAADFEEAILGNNTREKKLQVMTQKVSDAGTLVNTGLFNWEATKKTQIITYQGSVVYTVDLSSLTASDIKFNEAEKIITLTIPHAEQGEINIPSDKIEFGDVDKGMLAFGKMKITPEQSAQVQNEAAKKMQARLDEENVIAEADRFAILSVWEIYSPIVKGVAKDYSLEVQFRD